MSGFPGDLAPPIRRYPYEGRQQFVDTWEKELRRQQNDPTAGVSEWVLFTNVDERAFAQDFLYPSTPWTETRWTSYDAELGLLLANMPIGFPHAVATLTFHGLFLDAVAPTGLKYALRGTGNATHYVSGSAKNADSSWAPKRIPPGYSRDWPSVVLEVAFSESPSKLMSDIRFWLRRSQGHVKVVLTLQIDREEPKVTVEKWELQNDHPHRSQQIKITKDKSQRITIHEDPLVIEFADLFLRAASGPRETDIAMDAGKLQLLAESIWDEQGF